MLPGFKHRLLCSGTNVCCAAFDIIMGEPHFDCDSKVYKMLL